jgi:hypothetical protein
MRRIRVHGSRRPVWLETEREAGRPDRLTEANAPPAAPSYRAPPIESSVELFEGRIQLGDGDRRVSAYLLEPHGLIEIHAEHGCGGLTIDECEALSKWLYQCVVERQPPKSTGWFLRVLRLKR